MKQRLLLLNLVLLLAIAAAGTVLRKKHLESKAAEQKVLSQKPAPVPPPDVPPLPKPAPVMATQYAEVAQKLVVSRDRNPNVILPPPPPPPEKPKMPALPFAYGVMDFGSGPMVLLSEKAGGQNKPYKIGDTIGQFKILAVSNKEIVFEWNGEKVNKRLEELADKVGAATVQAEAATAIAGGKTAPLPLPKEAPPKEQAPPAEAKPSKVEMGENRACQPGDASPAGTVADGFRKVVRPSPFGSTCYWEPTK
jgi:hypothetical protein